ncbi:MAG: carboxypeptidase-like regulatory domain-containing protein [Dokdonella sp.]
MRFSLLAWILLGICLSFLAQAETTVEGSVIDAADKSPITGAQVEILFFAYPGLTITVAEMTTGNDGTYQWSGVCHPLTGGECDVHATAAGYREVYVPFQDTLALNQIDFVLQRISTVSGHVRRASDGSAVAGATVWVGDETAESGADGEYSVHGVISGLYSACATTEVVPQLHLIPQCFDHQDRGSLAGTSSYTPVNVIGGENLADIDFDLTVGGTIAGTLMDGHRNRPVDQGLGHVEVYDRNGAYYYEYPISFGNDGRYVFGGLPDGEYYVSVFDSSLGIVDPHQLYPGIVCGIACSSPTQGQLVTISNGGLVDGIDFVFHPDTIISGTVRDADTGEPVGSVPVAVYLSLSRLLSTTTDATGFYEVYVDGSGPDYHVAAEPGAPFINVGYPDQACTDDDDCWAAGDALHLAQGDVRDDVDFLLHPGAAVSGRVINSVNGQPLVAILSGYDADFNYVWSTITREDGSYTSPAWLAGTYYVSASPIFTSFCAFYANRPCPADGGYPGSVMPTPLAIGTGEIRQNVDFEFLVDEIFQAGFDL